jgi:hypothetical protein
LVCDLRLAYGDPDPVCSEAGKGLTAAYRETVVPQREANPATLVVAAYAAGVDQDERGLRLSDDAEAYAGELFDQVRPS